MVDLVEERRDDDVELAEVDQPAGLFVDGPADVDLELVSCGRGGVRTCGRRGPPADGEPTRSGTL